MDIAPIELAVLSASTAFAGVEVLVSVLVVSELVVVSVLVLVLVLVDVVSLVVPPEQATRETAITTTSRSATNFFISITPFLHFSRANRTKISFHLPLTLYKL
jgi:hypothetical protein